MATGGQGGGGRGLTPKHRREIRRALVALKARQALETRSAAYQAHGYGTAHPHAPAGGVPSRRVIRSGQTVQTGLRDTPRRPRANRYGLPADTGQSLSPPRSTKAQVAAYQHAHPQPFGPLGHLASQLAILAGSSDRVTPPPTGHRVKQAGLAPEQVDAAARAVAHSFAQDITDPQHHKLNFGLDLLSVLSGGTGAVLRTGAAVRGYREATAGERAASAAEAFARHPTAADLPRRILPDQTGLRRLRVDGGSVQVPHVSPNPITAAMQHLADRLSELAPDVPGVGAKARVAHHITEQNTVRLHRLTARAYPAEEAASRLRGRVGAVTPQQMAYTAIARYGHTGETGGQMIDLEVAQKLEAAGKATGKARRRLRRRADLLQAARPYVVAPTPEIQAALHEGRALSGATTESRVARGFTTPEVADQAVARHVRTVHGATFETPTPSKLGKETVALKRKRGRVESLQQRYDKAVERADKAGVLPKVAGVKTDAEIAREEHLGQQIAEHRQTLAAVPKGSDAKLQARLDEINTRWNKLVDRMGGGEGKYKTVNKDLQRSINAESKKRGRMVLSDELRRQKEQIALKYVEDNQHIPVVQRVKQQLEEADRLQAELTTRAERRAGLAEGVLHPEKATTAEALRHEIGLLTKETQKLALRPGRIGRSVTTEGRLLHARGTSEIERLGAALSVAKDELASAEKAAAARVRPTGLVGAETVRPGPEAFYTPDVQKPPLGPSVRSRVSINPPRDRSHASTMALFRQGRERVGPDVTIRDFRKEVRHIDRTERAKIAEQFSVPYDPEAFDPNVHALFDPHAAKTARELRAEGGPTKAAISAEKRAALAPEQEIDLQDALSPAQAVRKIVDDHLAWSEKAFPRRAASVADEHKTGLRMIDRKIADAIAGNDVVQRMETSWFGKFFDFSNQINRAGLIYLNPVSYGLVQGAGNVAFLGLQQGAFVGRNLPRYVHRINQLDRVDRKFVDVEVGGGAAAHLAHEGIGAGPLTKLADFDNLLADLMPRRIAWIHEAERMGFKTPAEIKALLHDEKLRPQLNTVSERAQQAMVKFQRRPTRERQIIGRAIFIAPWIEGSTRWLGRTVLDHPITARVANEIRDRIFQRQVKKLGYGHILTGSFIPVGKQFRKGGVTVIPGFDPQGASPFGSGVQTLRALGEVAGLTGHPVKGGTRLAGMFQPTLGAGITAFTRHDAYSGYDYPANRSIPSILGEQLFGSVDRPVFPAAATLATAFAKPQDISTEKASKMPLKYPEAGIGDALKRALLGSARGRLVVKDALDAKARTAKLQAMPMDKRVVAEVNQDFAARLAKLHALGQYRDHKTWEPVYQKAIGQRAQRKRAYVTQGADTAYKKLVVDLKLAVQHGMNPADARSDAAAFKGDTDGHVNAYRLRVQRAFLGQDAIDEISKALRDAGGG